MKKHVFMICLIAIGALSADTAPVMVSLVTPVQMPSRSYDVTGFRLSLLYGDCREFAGLDIGVIGHTCRDFTGLAVGGINIVDERLYGLQLGLINWNSNNDALPAHRSIGIQYGILNHVDTFFGLQDGFIDISGGEFSGLQLGFVNFAHDLYGLQCGAYLLLGVNVAIGSVHGCQIGLVNYADTIESGLQIGLVNIIANKGWLPVLPILNGHF